MISNTPTNETPASEVQEGHEETLGDHAITVVHHQGHRGTITVRGHTHHLTQYGNAHTDAYGLPIQPSIQGSMGGAAVPGQSRNRYHGTSTAVAAPAPTRRPGQSRNRHHIAGHAHATPVTAQHSSASNFLSSSNAETSGFHQTSMGHHTTPMAPMDLLRHDDTMYPLHLPHSGGVDPITGEPYQHTGEIYVQSDYEEDIHHLLEYDVAMEHMASIRKKQAIRDKLTKMLNNRGYSWVGGAWRSINKPTKNPWARTDLRFLQRKRAKNKKGTFSVRRSGHSHH